MNLLETAEKIGVRGFMHPAELEQLAELALERDVLEIGAFCGLSAWAMAIGADSVLCIDTFQANSAGQQQMEEVTTLDDFLRAVSRYRNVTHIVATSEKAAEIVVTDFDLVFLDAMHTYDDVCADICRWWPRVRSGGVMALHDYRHAHFPGVEQAADEVFGPAPEGTTIGTLRWVTKDA